MCMELYHGDEDYIEAEEYEVRESKFNSKVDEYKYEEIWLNKIDNDPIWVN